MKKHLSIALALCLAAAAPPLQAKQAMGFLTGSSTSLSPGLYTFDLETGAQLNCVSSISYFMMGGAYAEKNYWMLLSYDSAGNLGQLFSVVDPSTGSVLKNTSQNYGCTDMTYDLSTADLYGILYTRAGSAIPHQLVRIDRPAGGCTSIATLSDKFMTLACDLWGNLYAMNAAGVLHRIDKHTGDATPVGDTGIKASTDEVQSMEFDRDTGNLYWSFLDMNEDTWIAQVDIETGAIVEKHKVENNALLGALHIPYAEVALSAPNQLTDFHSASDGINVHFSWQAPTMAVDGSTLSNPLRLEIRREGQLVKTFTDVMPGTPGEWTDTEATQGADITYAFTCYDATVRGASLFTTVHVGDDVPAPVSDIQISPAADGITLTWQAPSTDRNGVQLDPSRLYYRVTRHPDEVVTDNVAATTFTDESLPVANQYSYTVTPLNHMGEGESRHSETVVAGPAVTLPWYPSFGNPAELTQFIVVDANNDNNTWSLKNGAMQFSCMYGAGDDWLITVPIHLDSGMQYKLSCNIATGGSWSPEDMKITLGTGLTPESQTVQEIYSATSITSTDETIIRTISVEETGDYTIGIQCTTGKWMGMMLNVNSLAIEPVGAVDLAIKDPIKGELLPSLETPETYTVTVYNNGTESQSGFTLSLLDDDDNVLATAASNADVAPGESVDCDITWTPLSARVKHLRAVVEKEGDVNAVNNVSALFEVMFLNEDEEIALFGNHDSNPGSFPFSFDDIYSFAESVYTREELGVEGGMVKEISWEFNNPGAALLDKDVQVYMANTSMSPELHDYLREEQMTCVFDGKVSFPSGENRLTIVLDTPFPYAGGNLAVLTKKNKDTDTGILVTWHAQNFPDVPRTAISISSNGVVNPHTVMVSSMLPCLRLKLDTGGAGSLSGTISCEGEAMQGALVSIDGKTTDALTDEAGRYSFGWLPAGDYNITVSPADYRSLASTKPVAIAKNTAQALDIALSPRPSARIEGSVTDDAGNPVAGAYVSLSGWENLKTEADDKGIFSFEKVYAHDNASVTTYAYGYKRGFETFPFAAGPEEKPLALFLEAVRNPVTTAWTRVDGDNIRVYWQPVTFSYELVADNGTPAGVAETETGGTVLLAKRFDGPLLIDKVKWHAGECSTGTVDYVNIYIYLLNEEGAPSQLALRQDNYANLEGQWNEFFIEDIEDEPVFAPYGCLVAIGAANTVALSEDDSHAAGCYVIDTAGGAYAPLADDNGPVNLLIRISAAHATESADMAGPDVRYNIYRLPESDKESADRHSLISENCGPSDPVMDAEWMQLPDDDYVYAVEAVFPGGIRTARCFTAPLTHTGIMTPVAEGLEIIAIDGALLIESSRECDVEIFSASGIRVARRTLASGENRISLRPGIYFVKAGGDACKVIVK